MMPMAERRERPRLQSLSAEDLCSIAASTRQT